MARTASGVRLAVNTQTPLLRLRDGVWLPTTGGVVRMLLPLLRAWRDDGRVRDVEWVALGADGEERRLQHAGLDLRCVWLRDEERRGYALAKEHLWEILNANPGDAIPENDLPADAWRAMDAYHARTADAIEAASLRMGGLDLAYVHDFQQLGVARAWRGPRVPMLFHLHTPFPSVLPGAWGERLVAEMERYDAIVVSTTRYAANLRAAGLRRPIHVVHPFIDPAAYARASPREVEAFREAHAIGRDDRIVLCVGRMDPMKGQDRLIRALPAILRAEPRARLVLVGNGSFSSSRRGGLGLDKGARWRSHLETLAGQLGIEQRVTFTGHLDDAALPAAYQACEVFALTSTREGFGLAAIEAWRHERPIVVCDRAGVAELVEDGVNGVRVDRARPDALVGAIVGLLRDPGAATHMGREGLRASRAATLDVGRRAIESIFAQLLEGPPLAAP